MTKSHKKKVLHVITGLEPGGGAETMLLRVLPHLEKTENIVCCMISKGEIAHRLEQKGVKVYSLNMQSKLDIRGIWRYRKILKKVNPDVQVNYLIHADIFGRIFGWLFGVSKIIAFIRNRHEETLYKFAERLTLPIIDCLLTNSPATMQFYKENYSLPDCRNVLPNGVAVPDRDKLKSEYLFDQLSIDKNDQTITCVARLHKQKDHDTLLKAFGKLQHDYPDTKLLFCGNGPRKKELKQLAHKLDITDNVLFLGRRDDINEILKIADVFVLPSLFEGMSNALLEAMAMGRGCIVSDIPENAELITDGQNGLTFQTGNSNDLCNNLQRFLGSEELRDKFGKAALEKIKESHSTHAERERFDNFLATL